MEWEMGWWFFFMRYKTASTSTKKHKCLENFVTNLLPLAIYAKCVFSQSCWGVCFFDKWFCTFEERKDFFWSMKIAYESKIDEENYEKKY